jgi:acyl carrier protein
MLNDQIRELIAAHANLAVDVASLDDDQSLYEAGMTSHSTVSLMLALEAAFDIEFPEAMLKRGIFESVTSIARALAECNAQVS